MPSSSLVSVGADTSIFVGRIARGVGTGTVEALVKACGDVMVRRRVSWGSSILRVARSRGRAVVRSRGRAVVRSRSLSRALSRVLSRAPGRSLAQSQQRTPLCSLFERMWIRQRDLRWRRLGRFRECTWRRSCWSQVRGLLAGWLVWVGGVTTRFAVGWTGSFAPRPPHPLVPPPRSSPLLVRHPTRSLLPAHSPFLSFPHQWCFAGRRSRSTAIGRRQRG